jgi:two-component system aerobic respiration control sensor histidine kinase ArcB
MTRTLNETLHHVIAEKSMHHPLDDLAKHSAEVTQIINYYESIISCMPGNVYWLDKNGYGVGCNKNVLDMFGMTHISEYRGLSFEQMGEVGQWSNEATQSFKQDTLEVIRTGVAKLNIEEPPIRHHHGHIIYFLTHRVPLYNEHNEVIGVVGISIDITHRKALEDELKKAKNAAEIASRAKTEFLENMRHDIRTPLTGIIGFADIIQKEAPDLKLKSHAQNLVVSSHALLDLLDEVLETVRVSSGEIPLLKKKFNLHHLLQHVFNLNCAKASYKKLQFECDLPDTLPQYVIGDKTRLHRIALELVANALNFTEQGHVKLTASMVHHQNRALILKLKVEDTGIGIAKEKQEDIYLQFKRLTPSHQGLYKGIGLGLYIVKQFIDDLEGEIYVESTPQKGSVFTCLIPLTQPLLDDNTGVDDEMPMRHIEKYPSLARDLSPLSMANTMPNIDILLVEDHKISEMIVTKLLEQQGLKVEAVNSGQAALEKVKQQSYALILMDIGLPDKSGYEIAQEIRAFEQPYGRHTPIVALTAHIGDENKQRCFEAGMQAVLSKPLRFEQVIHILQNYIPEKNRYKQYQIAEYVLFDLHVALKNVGSYAILRQVLELMAYQSLPEDKDLLNKGLKEKRWSQIKEITHKIKGAALYVGTLQLKAACEAIETTPMQDDDHDSTQTLNQLLDVMTATEECLKTWLSEVKQPATETKR